MREEYDKLVRDRIPAIIRRAGRQCEMVTMSGAEYRQALLSKLVEEAQEAAAAGPQPFALAQDAPWKWLTELADLHQVTDALPAAYGIEREAVLAEQEQRRMDGGASRSGSGCCGQSSEK